MEASESPEVISKTEEGEIPNISVKEEVKEIEVVTETSMAARERSFDTDPASYTYRDLLLLTQILYKQGIIEPIQVRQSHSLDEYGRTWFSHKCTVLSRRQDRFPLSEPAVGPQIIELYENMLIDYSPCKNTTELANCFYHLRIKDLENKLTEEKKKFDVLHKMA